VFTLSPRREPEKVHDRNRFAPNAAYIFQKADRRGENLRKKQLHYPTYGKARLKYKNKQNTSSFPLKERALTTNHSLNKTS
jgi:hypothetical protein